ncbi:MAG: hypothetical protein LUF04_16285 [Bacteroides sp.]|nr:hypothetical protein [Bacteroides sp.]
MGKHHQNTLQKIKLVKELAAQHYEPGNQSKSYHQVWRRHIRKVYPCHYVTFMRWINTDLAELEAELMEEERRLEEWNKRQLKLF